MTIKEEFKKEFRKKITVNNNEDIPKGVFLEKYFESELDIYADWFISKFIEMIEKAKMKPSGIQLEDYFYGYNFALSDLKAQLLDNQQ